MYAREEELVVTEDEEAKLSRLESLIGVKFNSRDLLKQALTHSSFVNGCNGTNRQDNERLEWIGDSVIEGIVSDYLFASYPHATPGAMTEMRDNLVSNVILGQIATEMQLGSFLWIGRGTKANAKIMGNALEALIGAIDLDQGRAVAKVFLMGRLFSRLSLRHKHNNIVHL